MRPRLAITLLSVALGVTSAALACLPDQSSYGALCGDNVECLDGTVCTDGTCLPPGDRIEADAGISDAG